MISRIRRPFVLLLAALLAASASLAGAAAAAQAVPGPALSSLTISTGTLDPGFSPSVTSYSVTVPSTVTSFSFTPTAADASFSLSAWDGNATITPTSGSPVATTLRQGMNMFVVTVTDPSELSVQYTIAVTREAPPAPAYDPRLSSLTVSEGALSPTFDPAVTSYSVEVPYTTSSITVAATSTDAVSITNPSRPMTGGTTFLQVGGNLVQVTVTAVDGTTTRTYDLSIVRGDPPTADVDLDGLQVSVGTLVPEFNPNVTSYTVSVPYAVRTMQITASVADDANTFSINNVPMANGVPSDVTVNYNGGSGYSIRVVAPNQVEKSYSVQITREPPSENADLTALSISEGTLSPVFDNAGTAYTAEVPYLTTSVTVTGVLDDTTAILRVNNVDTASGVASAPVTLAVGDNDIVVAATAEDGVTVTSRTITVTRAAPNLDLDALSVTDQTLTPAFDPAVTAYTLQVPYLTTSVEVAAAAVEGDWDVTIDGFATSSRDVSLAVGVTNVVVTVTALYGESRDYTIAVTREPAAAPIAAFDLGFGAGDVAAGSPFEVTGENLLPGTTATVTMYSTPVQLATALVPSSRTVVISTQLPASVPAGAHRLVFEATAEDGSPVSVTAWFTVLRNGTIGAVSLTGPLAYSEAALAATGAESSDGLALAAVLVMLGGVLLVRMSARRRRVQA